MSAQKFEKLIDLIINEDQAKAEQLFHDIIVEKSREIYESLINEDQSMGFQEEIAGEEQGSHGMMEDDEDFEDDEIIAGDFDTEAGDEDFTDEEDFDAEEGEEDFGDEEFEDEEGSGDLEDRVVDLEDKLDELMAEFESQMSSDDGEEEEIDVDAEEEVMESIEMKAVAKPKHEDHKATSPVASNSGQRGMASKPVNFDQGGQSKPGTGAPKVSNYGTKGEKEVAGAGSFKNAPGKDNFSDKGEAATKPVKTQAPGVNTRSAVPESKRTAKKRI